MKPDNDKVMSDWFWYAIGAAILYGLHQVFTRVASDRIGDGVGGFVVEATAAATIFAYLAFLYLSGQWKQPITTPGVFYSILTGNCVGVGTVFFFLLFQKGGPLGSADDSGRRCSPMATVGICFFREPASWPRLLGIALSIVGLFLLRS